MDAQALEACQELNHTIFMLCGKELILATRPFAKEIRIKSWYYTISTIILIALSLTATIVVPFLALKILFSIVAGLFMVRMFIIYHDHQHHSILTHSKLANIIMTGFGYFILSPYKYLEKIPRPSSQ